MKAIRSISFIVRNDPALLQNNIFTDNPLYGMKSDNYPFRALKQELGKRGIEFNTHDITPPDKADLVICLDEAATFKKLNVKNRLSYLIISEPPVYAPQNWDPANHSYFEKVFTYDKDLVSSPKYVHYVFAIDFESHRSFPPVSEELYGQRRLCCLIAGAMQVTAPEKGSRSLLYERYTTARYFARHHAAEFDIYGRNLINEKFEYFKGAGILKKLKLTPLVKLVAAQKAKDIKNAFKGSVPPLEKLDYHHRYNFSICYDNSAIRGCISERIFDCFISKSVPIYCGAPDIGDYIPKQCFINRHDFNSYSDLYKFIKSMPYSTYLNYLNAIELFLKSPQIQQFTVQHYVNTIISNLHLGEADSHL